MISKKKVRLYIKFIILLLCLLIVIRIFSLTLSKFEASATTDANIDIAFYILKENYQTMNLNLDSLFPRDTPYVYTFNVSNTDGKNIAETNLQYDLKIKTTTNLPLTYKLYINENYMDVGATNRITSDIVEADEHGTYFRNIKTDTKTFSYTKAQTDTYTLLLNFPITYNTIDYQDIIESIEVSVNSKQIIE